MDLEKDIYPRLRENGFSNKAIGELEVICRENLHAGYSFALLLLSLNPEQIDRHNHLVDTDIADILKRESIEDLLPED